MWRGDLSPLGREAALKTGTAAQSNGDKSPRHKYGSTPWLGMVPLDGGQGPQSCGVEDLDLAIPEADNPLPLQVLENLVGGLP